MLLSIEKKSVFISVVTLWEIAIKQSLGRFNFNFPLSKLYDDITQAGFQELPIKREHLEELQQLPFHHNDPFDRLLIAQALAEDLTFLSKDRMARAYPVRILW